MALDAAGRIYTSTREGRILRLRPDGSGAETYADTNGAPLGLHFDASGTLIVADAMRGLLRITPDRRVTVLATEADGTPIAYADDLDVARDGRIYFSDASTKAGDGPSPLHRQSRDARARPAPEGPRRTLIHSAASCRRGCS